MFFSGKEPSREETSCSFRPWNSDVSRLCIRMIAAATLSACFNPSYVVAEDRKADPSNSDSSKRQRLLDRVTDFFADHTADRNEVMKKCVAVVTGSGANMSPTTDGTCFHIYARGTDRSRRWDHRAQIYGGGTLPTRDRESMEVLHRDGEWFIGSRNRAETRGLIPHVPNSAVDSIPWQNSSAFDPFSDFVFAGAGLRSDVATGEANELETILLQMHLRDISEGLGGVITATWSYQIDGGHSTEITIRFDPTVEHRPVEIRTRFTEGERSWGAHTFVRWKEHLGYWLPVWWSGSESMIASDPNRIDEVVFKVYWLVGDEVPDEYYESDDPFGWILDRFQLPQDSVVDGLLVPDDFVPDADLKDYHGQQWTPNYFAKPRPKVRGKVWEPRESEPPGLNYHLIPGSIKERQPKPTR